MDGMVGNNWNIPQAVDSEIDTSKKNQDSYFRTNRKRRQRNITHPEGYLADPTYYISFRWKPYTGPFLFLEGKAIKQGLLRPSWTAMPIHIIPTLDKRKRYKDILKRWWNIPLDKDFDKATKPQELLTKISGKYHLWFKFSK